MPLAAIAALASALVAIGPTAPVPVVPVPASPAAREAFDRGRTAFGRAEYQRAIDILHPLVYPEVVLDSEGEVVQARRMLGVAYLFQNQPDEARREFRKLLELRPDYRFDPLLDPQQVVDFFNGVLSEEKATIEKFEERRRQRDRAAAEQRRIDLERLNAKPTIVQYELHSFTINFLPFGAGQFQNGERRKGWFFLGTETVLATVSVGAFATNLWLYGLTPTRGCKVEQQAGTACPQMWIDHSEEDKSRRLLGLQLVSGGLFFAVAIWGVIDAIAHFQPGVIVPEGANGRPPAARLMFSPGGLGATWAF